MDKKTDAKSWICELRPLHILTVYCNLNKLIHDYTTALLRVGRVVYTVVVMAATKGVVSARKTEQPTKDSGYIEYSRGWVKSPVWGPMLDRCRCHILRRFKRLLANIQAEVVCIT